MPIKVLTKKPAVATTVVENKHMGKVTDSQVEQEEVETQPITTTGPLAKVGLDVGVTIQTAPYNSTRVGVTLSIDCPLDEIDVVYEYIEGWVNTKMEDLTKDIEPYSGSQ